MFIVCVSGAMSSTIQHSLIIFSFQCTCCYLFALLYCTVLCNTLPFGYHTILIYIPIALWSWRSPAFRLWVSLVVVRPHSSFASALVWFRITYSSKWIFFNRNCPYFKYYMTNYTDHFPGDSSKDIEF